MKQFVLLLWAIYGHAVPAQVKSPGKKLVFPKQDMSSVWDAPWIWIAIAGAVVIVLAIVSRVINKNEF